MVEVDSIDSRSDEFVTMRVDVLSSSDESSLDLILYSSSFSSGIIVTMIGDESIVSNKKDTSMSAGSHIVTSDSVVLQQDQYH